MNLVLKAFLMLGLAMVACEAVDDDAEFETEAVEQALITPAHAAINSSSIARMAYPTGTIGSSSTIRYTSGGTSSTVGGFVGAAANSAGQIHAITSIGTNYPELRYTLYTTGYSGGANKIGQLHYSSGQVMNPGNGDLAFDPTNNQMYMLGEFCSLYKVSTSAVVTTVGSMSFGAGSHRCSAMAFDNAGQLYVLDTLTKKVAKVNKANGAILSSVVASGLNIGSPAYSDAGMAFYNNQMHIGLGNRLYRVTPTTGAVTVVNPAMASGVTGLVSNTQGCVPVCTGTGSSMACTVCPDVPSISSTL